MEERDRQEEIRELKRRLFGAPEHYQEHPWEWEALERKLEPAVQAPCIHEYHPLGGSGVKQFCKKIVRKLIRFYAVPVLEEQNRQNVAVAEALKNLTQTVIRESQALEAENRRLSREVQWLRSQLPPRSHAISRERLRVVQMLPALAFGDGIGNDTVALKGALQEAGYETEIYAEYIDSRLPEGTALPLEEYVQPQR